MGEESTLILASCSERNGSKSPGNPRGFSECSSPSGGGSATDEIELDTEGSTSLEKSILKSSG